MRDGAHVRSLRIRRRKMRDRERPRT
jgi:hypothetical protein